MNTTYGGLFVVFEGGEGSGKSTQAKMLTEALRSHDISTYLTHEPGDTLLGKHLRRLVLNGDAGQISSRTETLLFAADRAEHVDLVLKPNLELNQVVVCDRYIASTLAYQVYANGMPLNEVEFISDWASAGLRPDITFYLDVNPRVGLERSKKVDTNRFEDKDLAYHEKVRSGYLNQKSDSWVVINAEDTIENIHDKILDHVLHILCVLERFRDSVMSVEEVRLFKGMEPKPLRVIKHSVVAQSCEEAKCDNPSHGVIGIPFHSKPKVLQDPPVGECGHPCVDHPVAPKLEEVPPYAG